MSEPPKIRLGRYLEVEDGRLEAYVDESGAGIYWESKEDRGVREAIDWILFKEPLLVTVQDGTRTDSDDFTLSERTPNNLLRYRARFEGVNKKLDELLRLYDTEVLLSTDVDADFLANEEETD